METEKIIRTLANCARPAIRPILAYIRRAKHRRESFNVPVEAVLRGGEYGIRAARYAELTGDFLRPSTPAAKGPHVEFLREYDRIGEKILAPGIFEKTAYYRNAEQCLELTGTYFVNCTSKLKGVAEHFIREYRRKKAAMTALPDERSIEPISVRPIQHSNCFEMMDGNHRFARAILAGKRSVPVRLREKEPVLTPLQSLLLDVLGATNLKMLYQPLAYPEIQESWKLIRGCSDRLSLMKEFISSAGLLETPRRTYLDLGSSYGWFVKRFEELGFQSMGVERDLVSRSVGLHSYGLRPEQIRAGDIGRLLGSEKKRYDVVSLLSVLHHFVLGESSISAEALIRLADKITGKVLFLDTGQAHEGAYAGTLSKWTVPFIVEWLRKNTSFTKIIPLGKDEDRVPPFQRYYGRTLFACVRE
jgi:hypothetical protein